EGVGTPRRSRPVCGPDGGAAHRRVHFTGLEGDVGLRRAPNAGGDPSSLGREVLGRGRDVGFRPAVVVGRGRTAGSGCVAIPTHNPPPGQAATTRGEWSTKPRRPMSALGPEGMVARARTALGWAKSVKGIGEAQIRIQWEEEERLYLNTAGARCSQTTNRTHFTGVPVAIEGGRAEFDFLNSGGIGGEEILDALTEENLTATARRSKELLSAKAP